MAVLSSSDASPVYDSDLPSRQVVRQTTTRGTVYFEENRGQFDGKARYFARGASGFDLFLTATDAVYIVTEKQKEEEADAEIVDRNYRYVAKSQPRSATAVYMTLVGANVRAESSGAQQLEHRTNYFKGEESKWRTEIANFGQVRMTDVYEGIDAVWEGRGNGGAQYDFVIAQNSDPNQIKWEIKGARSVELDADGNLLIRTEHGDLKQYKPRAYQEIDGVHREVGSHFLIDTENSATRNSQNVIVKFSFGGIEPRPATVKTPSASPSSLAFSTFLGGSSGDRGNAIAVDSAGNVYVTGLTFSVNFPTTAGTFDGIYSADADVFVTKLNAAGTGLIYSTFIGGGASEVAYGIATDPSGNALITGHSGGATYPTTAGAFDRTHNGGVDVIVTKLSAAGSSLIFSTFLGGNLFDSGNRIAIDPSGNVFVTGQTEGGASAYPTTPGAFDETHNGSTDVFVTKLNPTGSTLLYSTLIGGNSAERGRGIAIDALGSVFIVGTTFGGSVPYPTTAGAFDVTFNGSEDVFVTKLNPAGSLLTYSTFIGGSALDHGHGITTDPSGNAFITGTTRDDTVAFPTTVGAFDETHNGSFDAFVTKLNPLGSELLYSTFIGGSAGDEALDIARDSSGNVFVTGLTGGGDPAYPTTIGAFDTSHNGNSDVFVTKLDAAGSALLYSTFIGGSVMEHGYDIELDPLGNVVITGFTDDAAATDYPATPGAFDVTHNGSSDAFVTKLAVPAPTPMGFESDVAPRPDGDGQMVSGDVVQIRRFVAGLDTVNAATNEFQRADSAPRTTFGDGVLGSADVVQARRYAAALDPLTGAAGPAVAVDPPLRGGIGGVVLVRKVELDALSLRFGDGGGVLVGLVAGREVAAMSFRLRYDAKLGRPTVRLSDGVGDAVLTVNDGVEGELTILMDSAGPLGTSGKEIRLVEISFANAAVDGLVVFDGEASVSDVLGNDVRVELRGKGRSFP